MTVEQLTARINELYHKSQTEGLSEAEKEEQHKLRQAYVANIRANLKGQLDHISIVEKDGTITNLGEKNQEEKKSKAAVRTKVLRRRDALTEQERKRYSQDIIGHFTSLPCYRKADALLAYASYRSEVETYALMEQTLSDNKLVFVPKVEGQDMEFYQITELSCLHKGYRDIPEPEAEEDKSYSAYLARTKAPQHILLCMPGAAFDLARHRIGYGGGFYDRYLRKLSLAGKQIQPVLTTVALAYSCQVLKEIPWESHDVIPDILLTEHGCI